MIARSTLEQETDFVLDGTHCSPERTDDGVPVLSAQNVRDGRLNWKTTRYTTSSEFDSFARRLSLKKGDVLLTIVGTIGRAAVLYETPQPLVFQRSVSVLRPRQDKLDSKFLYYVTQSADFQRQLDRFTNKSSQAGVYLKKLKSAEIPLPPLAEQKRIAAILDAADALRAKRRESLAQLDTLLQSTFLELFGDPEASGWPIAAVSEAAHPSNGSMRTGPFGSQLLHSEFVGEGIRVLGIDNAVENEFREGEPRFITPEKYEQLRRYTVKPGDVLITIMGTCGRCAIVPDEIGTAINTKHLCCITLDPEKCLPAYMHAYFLLHPMAREHLTRSAKGAIMSGLNMGIIKGLPIPFPPLDLQLHFAAIVESIERQKTRLRAHLAELDTLFASLQSRAFNGQL